MSVLQKLQREWKTFSLAILTTAVGTWEAARDAGYDLSPLVPEKYRPWVVPGVGLSFLILRKWKDVQSQIKTETVTETKMETTDVVDK